MIVWLDFSFTHFLQIGNLFILILNKQLNICWDLLSFVEDIVIEK
jgi:hypothetical protein